MHALAREIQQGQASQGQRNILSSSIPLCFLQPSFVMCHGKNSNEPLRAAGEIPVRHKPVPLSPLYFPDTNFLLPFPPAKNENCTRTGWTGTG